MEWLIVLMLILIGAVLIMLEFLVFPGVNVVGLIGFVCIIGGVYCGYRFYGTMPGHFILVGTVLFGAGMTWYALHSNTWKKMSLHSQIDSVVEGVSESIKEGDQGVCLGRLAPMGNVQFGDHVVEAESQVGYLNANTKVVVVKVLKNRVVVKPVENQE